MAEAKLGDHQAIYICTIAMISTYCYKGHKLIKKLLAIPDQRHTLKSMRNDLHKILPAKSLELLKETKCTLLNEFNGKDDGEVYTIVLESYTVDIPEGNTVEDTKMFVDTVVKLNLQKLGVVDVTGVVL
ncbi:hypothetical protein ACFE04_004116 [Oxalis oulophora]